MPANGSSAIANPVTVQMTVRNTGSTELEASAGLSLGNQNQTVRFLMLTTPVLPTPQGCLPPIVDLYHNIPDSYTRYDVNCDVILQPGELRTLTWRIWIQPSAGGTFGAAAVLGAQGSLIGQQQADLQVPQAQIRPVVVVPGILGSFRKGSDFVLDPLQGTYDGLIAELRYLGYEDGLTIVPFPYQWYGKLKDQSDPNDVGNLAGDLKSKIDSWWNGKTPPAYVRTDQFDIVAHSEGGLVTRRYIDLNGNSKVHTVFLVATPHQGAPEAYAAWEGLDTLLFDGFQNYVVHDKLVGSLAQKSGCYEETVSTFGADATRVSDAQLYRYLHGQNCITDIFTVGRGVVNHTTVDNGRQPGAPMLGQVLPPPSTQAVRPYLFDGTASPPKPANDFLENLNTPARVDSFVQQLTSGGRHLFSMYSDDRCTISEYNVVADPASAPLWMNGTAKPIPRAGGDCTRPRVYKYETIGDDDVPAWRWACLVCGAGVCGGATHQGVLAEHIWLRLNNLR